MIFWICFSLLFLPITLFFPTKIINKNHLPKRKEQNVIVCCNHTSNVDAPLLDIRLKRKFVYLAKIELFKNKLFGWLLKKFGCIPVDRSKADLGAIKKTLKALNEKKDLAIFPQGTRGAEGDVDESTVKEGVSMFALKTNTPVLPMAIVRKPKFLRRNIIMIGDLIYPDISKAKDKEYLEEFTKIVVSKVNELLCLGREKLKKNKSKN